MDTHTSSYSLMSMSSPITFQVQKLHPKPKTNLLEVLKGNINDASSHSTISMDSQVTTFQV